MKTGQIFLKMKALEQNKENIDFSLEEKVRLSDERSFGTQVT